VRCGKETGYSYAPLCEECFFIELMWEFRNDPNIKEDVKYEKQPDGSYKEIGIIRGIKIKELKKNEKCGV